MDVEANMKYRVIVGFIMGASRQQRVLRALVARNLTFFHNSLQSIEWCT